MGHSVSASGSVELSRPLVVAHRGSSLAYPENTLAAFEAAIAAGADMIELDARLSADGVAVVSHDADVAGTTDGTGPINELTLDQIRRLDAGRGRADRATSQGRRHGIPTLREALELAAGRIQVDIEVKNLPGEPDFDSPDEACAIEVMRVIDDLRLRDSVLVSSFNWLSIERVRELAPDVRTGFLTHPAIDPRAALAYARQTGHTFVLPHAYALVDVGEGFVEQAHADGVRVGTWTVDVPDDIAQLFAWGVDAVVTNDPAAGVRVRDAGG
jgi:glycerophosphoryl diester phosphodiesterase